MFLVDDALGYVSIDDVEREVEDFGAETELLMDFDEEVDEVGTHVPLEFGLHVDEFGGGDGLVLSAAKGLA